MNETIHVVQLTRRINIGELDIERSTYITPKIGESIIMGSCLSFCVLVQSGKKTKTTPAWKNFHDKFESIEFGIDFKAVLDFNTLNSDQLDSKNYIIQLHFEQHMIKKILRIVKTDSHGAHNLESSFN